MGLTQSPLIPTTKGSIVVGTGSTAFAPFAVGANDTVLVADSTAVTGLKWAAPVVALTLSTIASGSLNSGTSLTLSSLSSYDSLILIINGITNATADTNFLARINNSSSTVYNHVAVDMPGDTYSGSPQVQRTLTGTSIPLNFNYTQTRTSNLNTYIVKLTNCKGTGFTQYESTAGYFSPSSGGTCSLQSSGVFKTAAAVSSLVFTNSNGYTFNGTGTYELIGG
jgi:hypothetical protein